MAIIKAAKGGTILIKRKSIIPSSITKKSQRVQGQHVVPQGTSPPSGGGKGQQLCIRSPLLQSDELHSCH